MADYWIKLYHEIIDDPKMATLPDRLWRRVIELFLLAGKLCPDKSGNLPDTRQLAWLMRMSTDELQTDLMQLTSTGIIKSTHDGWAIINFQKRQGAVPGSERVKQCRERKQKQQYYDNVTSEKRNVTQSTESETESEQSRAEANLLTPDDEFDNMRKMLERNVGIPIPPQAVNVVDEMIKLKAIEQDIQEAIIWLKGQGKTVRYYGQLSGPVTTAVAKRVQQSAKSAQSENIKSKLLQGYSVAQ